MSSQLCATDETLLQWLSGQPPASKSVELDQHLECCSECQDRIEQLATANMGAMLNTSVSRAMRRLLGSQPSNPELSPTFVNPEIGQQAETGRLTEIVPNLPGYEIIRLLGRGGMGRVYLARQIALGRLVAVKLLSPHLVENSQLVSRLRLEAKALATLMHSAVVQVFDVLEIDGLPVLIMEYVSGGSLSQYFRSQTLTIPEICRICAQIAFGVHAVHEKGIIHRDLKPLNILMDGTNPKVSDFGLALNESADVRLTSTGELFGTPEYMAPEQFLDGVQASSRQSDIYAIGVIVYHLLTGHPPFRGSTIFQTMNLTVGSAVASIRITNPLVSKELDAICLKALEKRPEHRFSSAMEMGEALADCEMHYAGELKNSAERQKRTLRGYSARSATSRPANLRFKYLAAVLLLFSIIGLAIAGFLKSGGPETAIPGFVVSKDLLPEGSHWQGTFSFLPRVPGNVDGDMELLVEKRTGDRFEGVYYSEHRSYAWKVEGEIRAQQISWNYVETLSGNDSDAVVGNVLVVGDVSADKMKAIWRQGTEAAELHFDRLK